MGKCGARAAARKKVPLLELARNLLHIGMIVNQDETNPNVCWVENIDGTRVTFKTFMRRVDEECYEQFGLSSSDLVDVNFYAHYVTLSERPSWADWDVAIQGAMDDLKEENGVDW